MYICILSVRIAFCGRFCHCGNSRYCNLYMYRDMYKAPKGFHSFMKQKKIDKTMLTYFQVSDEIENISLTCLLLCLPTGWPNIREAVCISNSQAVFCSHFIKSRASVSVIGGGR